MSSPAAAPAPQRRLIQASLWKMKTSMTGGIKWKKKWVSSDGVVLAHWHSDVLPKKATPPKHTYVLERCVVIEFKTTRPYAFKIKDGRSKAEIVFACENVTEYAQWLSFLTDDGPTLPNPPAEEDAEPRSSGRSRSKSPEKTRGNDSSREYPWPSSHGDAAPDEYLTDTISGYNEMEATTDDIINDFFHNRNTRLDKEVSIRATEFWDLMKAIDERVSINTGRQAISLLAKKPGIIFLKDFLNWLHHRHNNDDTSNQSDTSNALRSHIGLSSTKQPNTKQNKNELGIFGGSTPVNHLHYVGILDSEMTLEASTGPEGSENLLHSSPFLKQKLPTVKNILTAWSTDNMGYSWNDRMQHATDDVLAAQNRIYHDTNGADRQAPNALLEAYFQYFAVKGEFYAAARKGVQAIVNEYSLPDHLRTADIVNFQDTHAEDDAPPAGASTDMADEEIFVLDGLVYRMMSVPSSSRDLESNSSDVYLRYVAATDTTKHKICGNENRAFNAVHRAVLSLFTNDKDTSSEVRPCVLTQTVVDFSGYRVQVFCPVYLEERRTLKYGQSTLEDIFISQDIPEPGSEQEHVYPKIFQQLSEKLNLRQRMVRTIVSDQPGTEDIDNIHVYESSEMILSKDIQLHQSDDTRFYLINFNNLMPPDIPNPDSNDVLTKHFRPEFVKSFLLSLNPEALSIENAPVEGPEGQPSNSDDNENADGVTTNHVSFDDGNKEPQKGDEKDKDRKKSVIAQNVAKMTVESIVLASKKLKTVTIVEAVKKLDYMVVFPMDSYGMSKFMHASGVNCRHLGLMYDCSAVFHVRQLLLCEAIARTVKVLLKQILQRCSRRGKAESAMAVERGRSRDTHFIDHQQSLLASKKRAVVDMFNLVLGSGSQCDEFWTGVMPSAVFSKFNLRVPNNVEKSTILHSFQLFEALQYHCGARFRDSNEYLFHNPAISDPFQLDDLIGYSPVVKVDHLYPGADHDLSAIASLFLKEKMYGEALNALRIQMSAVVLSQGTQVVEDFLSPKQRAMASHLTYDIGLCHFMLKQYDICSNVLLAQLESMPKYSVMAARMLTLLMCSTFLSGSGSASAKVNTALQYFESAKTMYYLTLGSLTPAHGLHVCALADSYFMSGAFLQAKVSNMIALDSFKHTLGDMHPVCASVACKVGNLMLAEKQYNFAVEILESAFAVYQNVNRHAASAQNNDTVHVYYADEAHCLHALAVALRGKNEVTYAMQCAVLSVDIATAENRPITPGIVHTLLILAEMYETTSDLFTAVALYQDVWKIVKTNPHVFPMSTMLADLAGRMVRVIVDMLPLQSRTLIDTILAEAEDPLPNEWEMAVNLLVSELWGQEPVSYIRDTIKQALEEAGETGTFSLASRLDNIVRSKAGTGIIGVPFSNINIVEAEAKPIISVAETPQRLSLKPLKRAASDYMVESRKSDFLVRSSSAAEISSHKIESVLDPISEDGDQRARLGPGSVSFAHEDVTKGPDAVDQALESDVVDNNAGMELTLNLKLRALLKLSRRKQER